MAVKKDIFLSYMERNGLDTGRLMALYNFTGSSGVLIYNNAYSTGEHHYTGDEEKIIGDVMPGMSIGESDILETSTAGENGFAEIDTSGLMQLGTGVNFEDWTVFFSIQQLKEQALDHGSQKVILSNSTNGTGISGFSAGIVKNRFYYQFPDTDGLNPAMAEHGNKITTITNQTELSERAVVSVSKFSVVGASQTNKQLDISVHDFLRGTSTDTRYSLNDRHSDNWYLGNFYEKITDPALPFWVGFSGYIDDMILVSGFINSAVRHDLSKTFCATGYQREGASLQEVPFTKITGYSYVEYNAVTGTGTVGYNFEKIADYPTQDEGNGPTTVSLYAKLSVVGEITGEKRTYLTGEATGSTVDYVQEDEETFYDPYIISGYGKDNIVPNVARDEDDVMEIYSYLSTGVYLESDNLSLVPKRVSKAAGDVYRLDINYTGENVNVYRNGVLQLQAPEELVPNNAAVTYHVSTIGGYVTGFYELGPEYGIKAGQKYFVDFTYDYSPYAPGMVNSQVGGIHIGMGVLTGASGNAADEWERLSENAYGNGTDGEGGMLGGQGSAGSGEVIARTDTLLFVHKPGGSERLPNEFGSTPWTTGNLSTIVIPDYNPDYAIENSGELQSSGVFGSSDDMMYDKIAGGARHFIWTGQSDNHEGVNREEVAGTGADGIIYFNDYLLGYEPYSVINNRKDINTDVYFNGQKMTSGVNYTIDYVKDDYLSGYAIKMDADTLNDATGIFQFAPTVSGMELFNHHSGNFKNGASSLQAPFTLMEEQVWVNGKRIKFGETEDYVKASRFSRLSNGKRLKPKTTTVYATNAGTAGSSGLETT